MFHVNKEKWKTTNDGRNRTTKSRKNQNAKRKENLEILGNIGSGHHQTCGDGRKKENLWRKLVETKLRNRNLSKIINSWAVSLARYPGPLLKWIREELQQIDERTRKLKMIHKALHPRDDLDRLCVSRNEGGRGLASIQDRVNESVQWLEDYIKKAQRKIDKNNQKQYRQHKYQQNKNYQKAKLKKKMGRKATLWTF